MGALSHIRVLDLSRVLAAPFATQILGDLGAEVIKIEKPGEGDETRAFGPPFLKDRNGERGDATYFLTANRNKKSVAIDFAKPEGAALVRKLARRAHVVVENFKTGTLAKYGLDYEALKGENPALIYCSLTGFGHTGPYKDKAGYDYLIQGMGGLMSITGLPDGAPGAEPMKVGVAISDLVTGLYTANAIQAALIHQARTGEGQAIDMALFDCQVAGLANQAMNYLSGGMVPGRMGNAHPNITPYQVFPVADGHIIIASGNDGQFAKLCAVLGEPELAKQEKYIDNKARLAHRAELIGHLCALTARLPRDVLLEKLEAVGVPAGPINDLAQVFSDPQVVHRGMKIERPSPAAADGKIPGVRTPITLDGAPMAAEHPSPRLGEHTEEILREIGEG